VLGKEGVVGIKRVDRTLGARVGRAWNCDMSAEPQRRSGRTVCLVMHVVYFTFGPSLYVGEVG
jgi:hypothetical protein